VFLGYASGVGKSYRMLDEGRRRKMRGQDVVVASVQPDPTPEVLALLQGFETIPSRIMAAGQAIDMDAVRRRRPSVCLIDGLAYRNPPGSANPERWQDVQELLDCGISVITTINLQYIREKQPQVEAIRGKVVTDSVPASFLLRADDIEVVDAPPEYVSRRAAEAPVPDRHALEHALSKLREIALVFAAEVVDSQLDDYLKSHGVTQTYGTHERILVCITPRSNAALMIGRGRGQADRFHGALFVAYVEQAELTAHDRATLQANLDAARKADAHIEILHGEDPVAAILEYATREGITQIFVGHSQRSGFWDRLRANPVERLILESSGIDVRIFPQKEASSVS